MSGHQQTEPHDEGDMTRTDELIALAALGEATADDERELDALLAADPDVRVELDGALDTAADLQRPFGVPVSPELRASVLDSIDGVEQLPATPTDDASVADEWSAERAALSARLGVGAPAAQGPDEAIERIETLDDALASASARNRRAELLGEEVVDLDAARRRRRRVTAVLSTAAAVLALVAVGTIVRQVADSDDDVIAAVVEADDAVVRSFDGALTGDLQAFYSASEGALVVDGFGLDPLDEAAVLQLWLVSDEAIVPVGTFRPSDGGEVSARFDGVDPSDVLLGITQEPAGGSTEPTLPVLATA